jgi:hypothetical protein
MKKIASRILKRIEWNDRGAINFQGIFIMIGAVCFMAVVVAVLSKLGNLTYPDKSKEQHTADKATAAAPAAKCKDWSGKTAHGQVNIASKVDGKRMIFTITIKNTSTKLRDYYLSTDGKDRHPLSIEGNDDLKTFIAEPKGSGKTTIVVDEGGKTAKANLSDNC